MGIYRTQYCAPNNITKVLQSQPPNRNSTTFAYAHNNGIVHRERVFDPMKSESILYYQGLWPYKPSMTEGFLQKSISRLEGECAKKTTARSVNKEADMPWLSSRWGKSVQRLLRFPGKHYLDHNHDDNNNDYNKDH